MQILLVEDDVSLASGLVTSLSREGFIVNHVESGGYALMMIKTDKPDIVMLDLGLPDMDGLTVLKLIRQQDNELPILVLTARAAVEEKVVGLDLGADDYLAKPFEMSELLARLRVLERRLSSQKQSNIVIGTVVMDTKHQQVQVNGKIVDLSRREYMLLKVLMENADRVQTRHSMESRLYRWDEELASNALEVHIHHLRKKLPNHFISTVRGVGYTIKMR